MKLIVALSVALMSCVPFGQSHPDGAPLTACKDMFPAGHYSDSKDDAPYMISVYQDSYYPGSNVTVMVQATGPWPFKGFFLQARNASCRPDSESYGRPIGRFYTATKGAKLLPCPCGRHDRNLQNAVTHTDPSEKEAMTFTWMNQDGGDVFFQATFVKERKTFWSGVQSKVIKDASMTHEREFHHCPARKKFIELPMVSSATKTGFNLVLVIVSMLPIARYL